MSNINIKNVMILVVILSIISGVLGAFIVLKIQDPNKEELIKDFYLTENAIHVSPHSLRKHMGEDDSFILVDLRSQEEYEKEHIIGAINIPAYKDPNTSAYGDVERIVNSFAALPKDKDIIVYCYSIPCMTGRKVGKMLSENGIYVKQLGIGWNEWRYYWDLWNHEHEWEQTNVEDYIATGSEPGILETNTGPEICDIEGEFGC